MTAFFSHRTRSFRKRFIKECTTSTTQRRARKPGSCSNIFFPPREGGCARCNFCIPPRLDGQYNPHPYKGFAVFSHWFWDVLPPGGQAYLPAASHHVCLLRRGPQPTATHFYPSEQNVLSPISSVRRIFSHRLQRERRLDHAAVYTLPFPPNTLQLIILRQGQRPYFLEKTCLLPFLKSAMNRTPAPVFPRDRFPLAACAQNIKYSLQHLPRWQWPSPLPW